MGCPSTVILGNVLTFSVTTHAVTGVLTDADAAPAYRVYEAYDDALLSDQSGNLAKRDDANTTGYYAASLTCSTGSGYEVGKSYNIYITAAVGGVAGGMTYGFTVLGATPDANLTQIGGDAQSATDLKDFADTGYDPSTHKIAAVSGNVDGSVASVAAGGITAASIAADAVTKIQADLAKTGADGDTLETLSDQIDGLATTGDGSVSVNHDTGGPDALTYVTALGVGIDNAVITAYLKSEYDAGTRSPKGQTTTDVNGQWANDMRLDPETYIIEFYKQGEYGPDTVEVEVTA